MAWKVLEFPYGRDSCGKNMEGIMATFQAFIGVVDGSSGKVASIFGNQIRMVLFLIPTKLSKLKLLSKAPKKYCNFR